VTTATPPVALRRSCWSGSPSWRASSPPARWWWTASPGSRRARRRRERDQLDAVLESVSDPILVTDDHSDIVLLNREADRLFLVNGDAGADAPVPVRTEPASILDQVRRAVVDADRAVMKS